MTLRTSRTRSKIPLNEEWREVPDWPGYRVSKGGRVLQTAGKYAPHVLTQSPSTTPKWNRWPYACVRLSKLVDGKKFFRHVRVHRIVMAAFVGPLPAGMEVNHKDGDHWNNALANLEYVTKRQNEDYAVVAGQRATGTRHGAHKLTEAAVAEIRAVEWGYFVARRLAAKYGVGVGAIRDARDRKTWTHVA